MRRYVLESPGGAECIPVRGDAAKDARASEETLSYPRSSHGDQSHYCRYRKLGLRVMREKTARVRFGCVDGFGVDAYRRGLGLFESMAFRDTLYANVDFRFARNLELGRHHRPSTIGIDTVYRSNDEIHTAFLRGAGIPDAF